MAFKSVTFTASMNTLIAAVLLFVFGCTSQKAAPLGHDPARLIQEGDPIALQYTCRLPNGEVVATTSSDVANDDAYPKSVVFGKRKDDNYSVQPLMAGSGQGETRGLQKLVPFESEIQGQLTKALVGMPADTELQLQITSEIPMGLTWAERYLRLTKAAYVRKIQEFTVTQYRNGMGHGQDPKVGLITTYEENPAVKAEVVSVEQDRVKVQLHVKDGTVVPQVIGKGVYRDRGDHYDLVTEVEAGDLVRMGWLVGRVSEVDDLTFTLDMGHPFGGEVLFCDVTAHPVSPQDQATEDPDGKTTNEPDTIRAERNTRND